MEVWKASLFGCFDHVPATLFAIICWPIGPCCLHLAAATKAMNGCMAPYYMLWYCGVFGYAFNRERIRLYYGIGGDCCTDCLIWYCCPFCAGVQEYRETILRGLEKKEAPLANIVVYSVPGQPGPAYVNAGQPNPVYAQPPNYAVPPPQPPNYAVPPAQYPNYPIPNNPEAQPIIIEDSSDSD